MHIFFPELTLNILKLCLITHPGKESTERMNLTFKKLHRLQVICKSDNEPFFKLLTHVGTDSTSVRFKLPCKYTITETQITEHFGPTSQRNYQY
jgi:hypothetical protein